MYINKILLVGNLTKEPELKALPSGTKVANLSIATNRVWYNDKKEKQEAVEYHNIVVFGRQAETSAQYLKKGSQALVEGRMQTRSWDDAGTGKKLYRTEVVADSVQFGSRPSQGKTNDDMMKPIDLEPQEETLENSFNPIDQIEYPEEDMDGEIPF